jgi:peptidoglycan/LPS O-acetylase OafA/YrhL
MNNHTNFYFSRLDHLRFIAAVIVIAFHFTANIHGYYQNSFSIEDIIILWLASGKSGVTLFLVLSGFLFTTLAKGGERKISYWHFLLNRFLRIYPLLILLFLAIICVNRQNATPLDLFRLIFLQLNTGNPVTGWGHNIFPVGPIWTIAVEFQFYLLFPILMRYVHENGYRSLVGFIVLINIFKALIVLHAGNTIYFNIYHSTIGRLDQFMVGIITGVIYLNHKNLVIFIFKTYGWFILAILLVLFTLLFKLELGKVSFFASMPGLLIEALLWSLIILTYMHIPLPVNKYINKFFCAAGERSYSIYLLHLMLGQEMLKHYHFTAFGAITNAVLNTLFIVLPITLLVSDISYRFIERPFMAMRVSYFR